MSVTSKEAICNSNINDVISQYLHLKLMVSMVKSKYLNGFMGQINAFKSQSLSPLGGLQNQANDLISGLNGFKDQLESLGPSAIQGDNSIKDMLECLGIDVPESVGELGFNLQDIPGINVTKHIFGYINNYYNMFTDMMNSSISSAEQLIGESLSKLENMISTTLIDSILEIINCLAGCSNVSSIPSHVNTENLLATVGLDIQGTIDPSNSLITNLNLSTPQLDQCLNIKDIVKSVSNKCNDVKKSINVF